MQQQQADGSYQELWPKNDSWNKTEVLSNSTKELFNLDSSAKPDEVFSLLNKKIGPIETIFDYTYTGENQWSINILLPSSFKWSDYNIVIIESTIVTNSRSGSCFVSFTDTTDSNRQLWAGVSMVNIAKPLSLIFVFLYKNSKCPFIWQQTQIPDSVQTEFERRYYSSNLTMLPDDAISKVNAITYTRSQIKGNQVFKESKLKVIGVK